MEIAVGEIDSEGHLYLRENPEAWIKRNPASLLSSVTSLTVRLDDKVEEIGESIGELSHLIRLTFLFCKSLKSVPNTITRLRYLKHLEFDCCYSLEELPANIGQLVSLTHLNLSYCKKIKYLPNSIAYLPNFTSLLLESCKSLVRLPVNIGHLVSLIHVELSFCDNINSLLTSVADLPNLTSLSLESNCSISEIPSNLGHLKKTLTHLSLSDCGWEEVPASLCQLGSLTYLYLLSCNNIKSIPKSITNLYNLTALSLSHCHSLVELPPYLDGLAHLCILDIQYSSIKFLPWSIMNLPKLRHLMLPSDFRLETLPDKLNNSVIISVNCSHVRKSWEELKKEMPKLSVQIDGEIPNDSIIQNTSIIYPPGYLRLNGDPSQWIINNKNLLNLVRILDLENVEELTDSITQFSELTHLYLNLYNEDDICLLDDYLVTLTRLRHLSLEFDEIDEIGDVSIFHSLSKLSNLESLHLCFVKTELPADINMPDSLNHLSLSWCEDMWPLVDSLEKLTNLKSLDLYFCDLYDSLLSNLNLEKLKLCDCSFKSLSVDYLRHLEILCSYKFDVCWGFLNQLVNLETLSITSSHMEFLPEEIARLRNLQKLQLKDCVNLRELPLNLHELVNLHTLDISITRIKSLPPSFMKLPNLQHLILPKCFNLKSLPRNLKQVSVIDDTADTPDESKNYYAFLYQASADTPDESEDKETEQGVVPQDLTGYNSPKEMPDNMNFMNRRLKYDCSMRSPPRGLGKAEHLKISLCTFSEELLANLKDWMSLKYIAIQDCCQHHVKKFPTNFSKLANLKTLSIRCNHIESLPSIAGLSSLLKLYISSLDPTPRLEKLPADLDKLDRLLVVDIHDTKIKCLPWSINKLQKLRLLFLPLDFRLETLPSQLIESVVITVDSMHIRKTWKELKAELGLSSFRGVGVDPQSFSTISSSGYLQLKEDPGLWIVENYDLLLAVLSLELELPADMLKIGDSIRWLPKLTYLYISGNIYLDLKPLSGISKTLKHLSLQHCNIESLSDCLGKLSNLESLCLDLGDTNLPNNLDVLVNLKHLSLRHGGKHSNIDGMAKLPNLKALDLFECELESLPVNLNLAKLKLSGSNIRSLPASLYRLEILHDKGRCERTKCEGDLYNLKQLINLERLSVTCYSMELLPNIERLQNLIELQLKDCFSQKSLPTNLGGLVKLCTLDISGTRIKSLPDSIKSLHNLKHLIVPKCFKQDSFTRKGFLEVSIDDTDEMYFKNMSDDDDEANMETSDEGTEIEPDSSIERNDEVFSKETEEGMIDAQSPQRLQDPCYNKGETSNPIGESSHAMQNTITMETTEQGIGPCDAKQIGHCGEINHVSYYNKGETSNPSGESSHVTPIIGDLPSNRKENSNPEGQSISAIQNDITTVETEQGNSENSQNQILQNDMQGIKRKDISLEMLQSFWSRNMTLEEAAEEIKVSRSTMKRKLKDLKLEWQSRRKGKQHLDAKKRKHNNKAPFESDCSHQNLVNPGNSAARTKTVGVCITGSDLDSLPNQVSSNSNAAINSTPDTTMEATRDDVITTQCDMDCHQRAQEQLDGANELTVVSNTSQQNENSSNFVVKATYNDEIAKFEFSLSCSIDQLKKEVANQLELEADTFNIKYQDEDKDWILMKNIYNLKDALNISRSNNSSVRLSIFPKKKMM